MTAIGREGESLKGRAAFSPGGEYDPDRRAEPIQRPDGQGLRTRAARRSGSAWYLHDIAVFNRRGWDERVRIIGFEADTVRVQFLDFDLKLYVPYGALREER